LALVVIVVAVGSELSERGAWKAILNRMEIGWVVLAVGLQILTYFAEGENWRVVLRVRRHHVSALRMWPLAMAKLFVDQAIPSAGLSGTAVIVFVSFMVSSLLRTVGVVPAGLGPFEAVSVATLSLAAVPVSSGFAATLLFRLLSFWLPLVPGMLFARAALRSTPK